MTKKLQLNGHRANEFRDAQVMKSANRANRGGVAAGHEETAHAAIRVLDDGGNAFDAAIAAFLAACVSEPVLASLGGGGFMTVRTQDGEVRVFDFFTQTPLSRPNKEDLDFYPILADFGTATQEFHIGLGSVATPGAVAGIFAVHDALGHLPMPAIAKPAIELAARGLPVNAFQAYLLQVIGSIYRATDESAALYCATGKNDSPPSMKSEDDIFRVPEFADFLTALSHEGPDLFYKGEVADKIATMNGCSIDRLDLRRYAVATRVPMISTLNGYRVFLNPPPAIGGALIDLALCFLDREALPGSAFHGVAHVEAMLRTMTRCNEARRASGIDTDPLGGAAALKSALQHPPSHRGTTHISVADCDGNLAAITVSNGEGCGHIIPGTGVMLNNMLGEEDLNAAGFFEWPEDVRLSSMMAPGVMVSPDGHWTAFGSGGSNRIRSALTQVISNIALFGLDCAGAVGASRTHLENRTLSYEPGIAVNEVDQIGTYADRIEPWPAPNMFFGGAHLITECDGQITDGAGDHRRDGVFLTT